MVSKTASGTYVMTYYKSEDPDRNLCYSNNSCNRSFVVGTYYYKIAASWQLQVWTRDHGAANNTVGTIFAATGVGSGTGTAFIENSALDT